MLARKASLLTRKARLTKHFDHLCEAIDSGEMNTKEAFSSVGNFILENNKALKKYSSLRELAIQKQELLLMKEFDLVQNKLSLHKKDTKKSVKLLRKFIRHHKKELLSCPSVAEKIQKKYRKLIYKELDQDFEPVKKSIDEIQSEDIDKALSLMADFISSHKKSLLKSTPFRRFLAENHQELLGKKFNRIAEEIEEKSIEEALDKVEEFINSYKKTLKKFSTLIAEIENKRQFLLEKKFDSIEHSLIVVEDFLLSHQEGLTHHPVLHEKVQRKYHDLLRREVAVLRAALAKVEPWEAISDIEKFIIQHRKILTFYPDEEVKNHYYYLIREFSNNLGEISRSIFLGMSEEDLYNTSIKTTSSNDSIGASVSEKKASKAKLACGEICPESHLACVNASENVASKIVAEIIGCHDIDERTLTVWRYIIIAKMRLDVGDYQSAEFIVSALAGPATSRLKATMAGLPSEVLTLQKLMDGISIKSDTHVLRHRRQPIIPSLARIKKLMTFANDEHVSKVKRNGIRAMLKTIHEEISRQDEIKSHLNFFNLQTVVHAPWMSLDAFNAILYEISLEIERRGENIPPSNLLANGTQFLPNINLQIDIDEKINTFLKIYIAGDTIQSLFKSILDLLNEINDFQSIPFLEDAQDILQGQSLRDLDRLINRFADAMEKNESDSNFSDKIADLLALLTKLRSEIKSYHQLEKKYKKLEKKYREHTVSSADFTRSRKNSLVTPKFDVPIYQSVESEETDKEKEREKSEQEKSDDETFFEEILFSRGSCPTASAFEDMDALTIDLDDTQVRPVERVDKDSECMLESSSLCLSKSDAVFSVEKLASTSNILTYLDMASTLAEEGVKPSEKSIAERFEMVEEDASAIEKPASVSKKLLDRYIFFERSLSTRNALEQTKRVKIEIESSEIKGVDIGSKIKLFDANLASAQGENNVENKVEEEITVLPSMMS